MILLIILLLSFLGKKNWKALHLSNFSFSLFLLKHISHFGSIKVVAAAAYVLLVLLALGLLTIPEPFGAILLVAFLLLFLPGLLLSRLIQSKRLPLLDELLLAFSLSVGLWSVAATLLLWLHTNLSAMTWVVLIIILFLSVATLFRSRPGEMAHATDERLNLPATTSNRTAAQLNWPRLIYWGAFFAAITLVLVIFINTTSPFPGDRLTYQAFVRHFLDAEQFLTRGFRMSSTLIVKSAREVTQPWLLLLALVIKLAQVDLLEAYVYYIPPLLILVSFVALYLLAEELFNNQLVALTACLIQTFYYLSDILANEEGIGFSLFLRIIEDKFLIRFILLPVSIWLTLRFVRKKDKGALVSLLITIVALGLVHPMGLVLYGISFGAFMLTMLLFGSRQDKRKKLVSLAPIIASVLVMLLVPLWERQQIASSISPAESYQVTAAKAFDVEAGLDTVSGGLRARRLLILSKDASLYIASPSLIAHPLVVLAILLTPLLIKYLRSRLSAQFLLSNMAGVLILCYTPVITPLLGKAITPWMIWRVLWLLPVSLVISFFLGEAVQKSMGRFKQISPQLLQLMPLSVILVSAIVLRGEIMKGLDHLEELKGRAITSEERALLTYLHDHGTPGSYIMTPSARLSDEIPGLVGHSYSLTFRVLPSPFASADDDRAKFYDAEFVTNNHLDILQQYNIKYIILERETNLADQFKWLSSMFKPLYANQSYLLYQWQPELATQAEMEIIQGNTYLLQGDLAAAESAYREALRYEPEHPLAAIGLGHLYLDEARVQDALAVYQQAIASVPHDPRLHIYLAEAYLARGETAEDPEAYREAVKAYRQAFDLAPDNPQIQDALVQAYLALGDQYFEQNLLSQVIAAYEKAIQLDPDNRQAYWKLAEVYETLGQLDQAVAVYAQVVARWPDRGDAHLRLGQAYEARGNVEQAVAEYKKAIDLDPALAGAYTRLGDLYENRDTPQEAIGLYRTAARKNPDAAWPHLELGKLYLNQGIAGTGDETN
jgi:tetratricopeptide (TPR) repeat protein